MRLSWFSVSLESVLKKADRLAEFFAELGADEYHCLVDNSTVASGTW
jgi:hypothetical protein